MVSKTKSRLAFFKNDPLSPDRSLDMLLLISGLYGFISGAVFYPCWQVAAEGAQVIAGLVKYPSNNPFYIYQIKAWTLLHQIPALGLRLGLTEKFLSIFLSGVMGLLSLQALTLSVYALCRNLWFSLAAGILIYITVSYSLGVNYPIYLTGTSATYGSIGLSFLFVAVTLLTTERIRWGAFMLGLSPAVHAALGALGILTVLVAILMEWKKNESLRRNFLPFFALGIAFSLCSYSFQWPLIRSIPSADGALAKQYFSAFIRHWDSHRKPISFSEPGVVVNGVVFFLSTVWLWRFRKDLSPGSNLMMRIYQIATALSLLFSALSWLPPESLPLWFLSLMSTRLLNFTILGFPGIVLGLWSVHKKNPQALTLLVLAALLLSELTNRFSFIVLVLLIAQNVLKKKNEIDFKSYLQKIPRFFLMAGGVMALGIILRFGVFMVRFYEFRSKQNWNYWQNDPFYQKVSEGKGLLLLAPDLYMQQLLTRRPVLIDGQALDMLAYALEGGPEIYRILKEVYRIDLFSPPEEVNGTAVLPSESEKLLLENRGTEEWKKIRREFGVTQFLISKGSAVPLARLASNDEYELYEIPQ